MYLQLAGFSERVNCQRTSSSWLNSVMALGVKLDSRPRARWVCGGTRGSSFDQLASETFSSIQLYITITLKFLLLVVIARERIDIMSKVQDGNIVIILKH